MTNEEKVIAKSIRQEMDRYYRSWLNQFSKMMTDDIVYPLRCEQNQERRAND